jgi:hypothetical protein
LYRLAGGIRFSVTIVVPSGIRNVTSALASTVPGSR